MPFVIEKAPFVDVPHDAVIISKDEAFQLQMKTIYNWEAKSEVWPFRWGMGALSGAVATSSLLITNYYRQRTKLFRVMRLPMYLPTVVLPTLLLPFVFQNVVMQPILLRDACPVCIEVRSIALQCSLGIVYPILMSSVTSFMVATYHGSYDIPPFSQPLELGRTWIKISSRLHTKLFWLWPMQAVFAATITYLQANSFYKIQKNLLIEDKLMYE